MKKVFNILICVLIYIVINISLVRIILPHTGDASIWLSLLITVIDFIITFIIYGCLGTRGK